jgi:hypothetical protein
MNIYTLATIMGLLREIRDKPKLETQDGNNYSEST